MIFVQSLSATPRLSTALRLGVERGPSWWVATTRRSAEESRAQAPPSAGLAAAAATAAAAAGWRTGTGAGHSGKFFDRQGRTAQLVPAQATEGRKREANADCSQNGGRTRRTDLRPPPRLQDGRTDGPCRAAPHRGGAFCSRVCGSANTRPSLTTVSVNTANRGHRECTAKQVRPRPRESVSAVEALLAAVKGLL